MTKLYIDDCDGMPKRCPSHGGECEQPERCNGTLLCYDRCAPSESEPLPAGGEVLPNPVWMARFFHETYERLAPQFGYETRQDTRVFDHESANGRLMAAVCEEFRKEVGMDDSALDSHPSQPAAEGTPTPRTDAVTWYHPNGTAAVDRDFARTLERELAEAQKTVAEYFGTIHYQETEIESLIHDIERAVAENTRLINERPESARGSTSEFRNLLERVIPHLAHSRQCENGYWSNCTAHDIVREIRALLAAAPADAAWEDCRRCGAAILKEHPCADPEVVRGQAECPAPEERDIVLSAIDSEPEVPGHMPDAMWNAMRNDKDAVEECVRIAVRQTKEGIRARYLAAMGHDMDCGGIPK